ncbi:MAG: redoxin family protein [Parvularculaceae bacterium]|nr:redoxin family protein [Parvularculaceae bacterium]
MKAHLSIVVSAVVLGGAAFAEPAIDAPAPAFSGPTSSGGTISLDQFKGQNVVLEWTNDGCPFVQKHYQTGNMQKAQKAANEAGTVWITVMSSAPGKQGHADATRAKSLITEWASEPDFVLLDPEGVVGKAYGAKTTPQMALIDGDGILRYSGAIDNKPSANHAAVEGAQNYVLTALASVLKGEAVAVKETKPYGCSIKYKS